MLPRMVGLAAVQINFLVNTILASGLAAGSLAALNYAWLLMLLPQGVFAQAVATAAFPTFSSPGSQGPAGRDAQHAGSHPASGTLPGRARGGWPDRAPRAAGAARLPARSVYRARRPRWWPGRWASLPWGCRPTRWSRSSVRAFYALHDTRTPVAVGIGAMGLNIVLSLAFIQVFRGLGLDGPLAGWPSAIRWRRRSRWSCCWASSAVDWRGWKGGAWPARWRGWPLPRW